MQHAMPEETQRNEDTMFFFLGYVCFPVPETMPRFITQYIQNIFPFFIVF